MDIKNLFSHPYSLKITRHIIHYFCKKDIVDNMTKKGNNISGLQLIIPVELFLRDLWSHHAQLATPA